MGHTSIQHQRRSGVPVHPHACGAYFIIIGFPHMVAGSSPRLWGIQPRRRSQSAGSAVHPHACGAYSSGNVVTVISTGSSPRLWGIRLPMVWLVVPWAVHPHACGAYGSYRLHMMQVRGSSPRLWGIRGAKIVVKINNRFIPTPVGHTPVPFSPRIVTSVHPHACGAYLFRFVTIAVIDGSSPRLWGILRRHILSQWNSRFIPTPVGHTFCSTSPP